MRRREVIAGLGAAAFAAPFKARAQQPAIPIIGFLSGRSRAEVGPALAEFHRGLGDLGFVEGRNVAIDYQWAEGRYDRLPGLAAALVERPVVVIAASGGNSAALAAKAATSAIPIVFTLGGDPVTMGLVSSLNQPGGNATGVTLFITELGAKRFELLRELAPKAARIAVLVNPSYPSGVAEARDVQARGPALGLDVDLFNAATAAELEPAFASIATRKMDALLTAADPFLIDLRHRIVRMAADQRLPAIYHTRDFAEAGGLMSYGASVADGYYTNGSYVGQILKGARPAALPVQQPTKVELVINLKTARALGLAFPLPLLGRADEVIE
jgi:putative tryptophan/tyrosine transport system substrate-binding protein